MRVKEIRASLNTKADGLLLPVVFAACVNTLPNNPDNTNSIARIKVLVPVFSRLFMISF